MAMDKTRLATAIKTAIETLAGGGASADLTYLEGLAQSIIDEIEDYYSGGGTTNHPALSNLDYAHAGHTGFQPALGYTAENESNKKTTLTDSDVDYPTTKAVNTGLNGKQNVLGFTPEDVANKSTDSALGTSDTLYPTQKAVKEYVDTAISGAGAVIAGTVIPWPGSSIPSGYLNCDGSAISRTTYARLFTAIGTTWGAGDGSTTFNIPDLRSATLRGVGTPTLYTSNTVIGLAQTIDDKIQGFTLGDTGTKNLIVQSNNVAAATGIADNTYAVASLRNAGSVLLPKTDGANGTPRTGLETTGKARGVYWLIKY